MSTPYIVSARKYRPSTFKSVVGQPSLTLTLKNAIDSDRLAQAYLFCGPRGVGKTSCARIFAKTINCEHRTPEGEACNECDSCRAFNEGRSINVVEMDAASNNSVDNIRTLNEQVRVPPQSGRYRVFIIDEVHMLSTGAFNAFLKTLEEPPSYVIFILATTEKHKVIPTILSRCQIYDFNRIGVNDIAGHLAYVASQEGVQAEPAALGVIARKADGAMRDALSIFDQVSASCRGNITYHGAIDNLNVLDYEFYFRLTDAFLQGDVPSALLIYKEVRDKGFDSLSFISGLANHLRELMVAVVPQTLPLLEVSADVAERYRAQAAKIKPRWVYAAMNEVNYCDLNYRTSGNKQFLVELTLIHLCQLIAPAPTPEEGGSPARRPALKQPAAGHTPQAQAQTPSQSPAPQAHAPQTAPTRTPLPPAHTDRPVNTPRHHVLKQRPTTASISVSAIASGTARPSGPAPAEAQDAASEQDSEPHPAAGQTLSHADLPALTKAWDAFPDSAPDLAPYGVTMRRCRPQATQAPSQYVVMLDNPGQRAEMDGISSTLMPYLRKQTGDAALTIKFEVAPRAAQKRILTKKEAFEQILENHEEMRHILSELDAYLAD